MSETPPNSNELAVERTLMAATRTLQAWIRTALSMLSFGFTIAKIFQYLRESGAVAGDWRPVGPTNLGLALIVLGTALLMAATVEHILFVKRLQANAPHDVPRHSIAVTAAIIVVLIGVILIGNLLLQVGPF